MEFGQAVSSASGEERTPPQDRPSGGVRRDPVCARHRMPVASNSSLFSESCDGLAIFPSLESRRDLRPDDGQASRARAQAGRPLGDPDRGGDRHLIGEDDGERRAFGLRRGQEGRGAQAPPCRRRRGAPARARRPQRFGAGSGRSSGGDPRGAGESTAHQENLGGRRISMREAGVRAHEARHRIRS